MAELTGIVSRYNAAWLNRDVAGMAAFLADGLVLWHNHIGKEFSKPEMLGFIAGALDVIDRVEFRDIRQIECEPASVLQQHALYVRLKNGFIINETPNCIIYTLRNQLIVRIDEYIDGRALSPVQIAY